MPFIYQLHAWRKAMKVGYAEALTTPMNVIAQDLEILDLENQYLQPKEESQSNTKPRQKR